MLKNTLATILALLALAISGYTFYLYSLGPCEQPLKYKLGRFDTRFGINEKDFKMEIERAEIVWEKVLNSELFSYDPEAKFKINLIYDERQLATVQKQK